MTPIDTKLGAHITKPYIISADSTLDMPMELIKANDIRVIASCVTMGNKTVDDRPDLTRQQLLDYVRKEA